MTTPKRILIACGGTGGHLAPGIALAQCLQERGHACRLLISAKQVDKRLSQKYPELTFESLPAVAFSKNPVGLAKFGWSQIKAVAACLQIMRGFKPDVVVGFGGFITVSAALCARMMRVPLLLHEANHRVGRTIRLLAHMARTVYVPLGIEPFPRLRNRHIEELALPLRRDQQKVSREQARHELGLPLRGRVLAVMGGSQGATALNQWAIDNEQTLLEAGIHLYCITGMGKIEPHQKELSLPMGQLAKSIFVNFSDQMNLVYTSADLVVARAGASTMNELIYFNTPSILIPFPHSADEHQWANARWLEKLGGTIVVDEAHIEGLLREVSYALRSETLLESLRDNLAHIDMGHPAETIANAVETLRETHAPVATPKQTPSTPLEGRFEILLAKKLGKNSALKLLLNEPIGPKTTFGVGGAARFYAEPANEKELRALLQTAQALGVEVFFLGRGSNLLVLDTGFDGLVIRLSQPAWQKVEKIGPLNLRVGAGVRLKALCAETARLEIAGFEFLEGIPATVGGACRGNAGAMGSEFFQRVAKVRLMDRSGRIFTKSAAEFTPKYRKLEGVEDAILLSMELAGTGHATADEIREKMHQFQLTRHSRQPQQASPGCFFRNHEGQSAGAMIDQAGLKGLRVGDAAVSDIHANFLINLGHATSSDVIALANQIRREIFKKHQIVLEPEIMLLGGRWKDYLVDIKV